MTTWQSSLAESLRQVEERFSVLEAELQELGQARDALRALVRRSDASATDAPADPAKPASESDATMVQSSLLGRMVDLVAASEPGTSWKAVEFARAVGDGDPTRSQIEACRAKANQLVAKALLVKNSSGSFTKPEVGTV